MQNVKETIQYVLDVFEGLGINYMIPEDFRQAKHSQLPQKLIYMKYKQMEKFQKLIFDLIILNATDFKIKLKDYNIEVNDYEKLKQFILQYLIRLDCSLIINHKQMLGFNFNNMRQSINSLLTFQCLIVVLNFILIQRDMLLLVGWLMAISNIFDRFEDICINHAIKQVEEIVIIFFSIFKLIFKINYIHKIKKDQIMQNEVSHDLKKRLLQLENNELDELLVENYNLLMNSFRKIQNLLQRKQKKVMQFKEKLSIQGVQLGINEFILMTNPEILQKKAQEMKQLSELIESMSSRMRNQEIFWEWLESVVEVDKKEYQNESDYGFPNDIKDLTVVQGLSQVNLNQHQDNLQKIQQQYSEIFDSMELFNKYWQQTQKNMNKLYSEDLIEELKENFSEIAEDQDQKLPTLTDFMEYYQQQSHFDENNKLEDLQINQLLQFLNYNSNPSSQQKGKQQISTEEVKKLLNNVQTKQKQQQEKLKSHINHIFDSISNVVTAYPNYQ